MKTGSPSRSRLSRWGSGGVTLLLVLAWQPFARGHPRPPWPPLPEVAGPVLFHEGFDWAWAVGMTHTLIHLPNYGTLSEWWSGLALQRCGPVNPFVVPVLDSAGGLNVPSHADGAVRFWLTPRLDQPGLGRSRAGQRGHAGVLDGV